MEHIDDSHYIGRVLGGEPAAYAALVDRHKNMAYNIALKIVRNPEDAEEITQDSFVKAYRSLGSFKGSSKFSTWLYRIVYNTSVSHIRKNRREVVMDSSDPFILKHPEMIEEAHPEDGESMEGALRKVLDKLPAEEQTIINLFYYEQMSIEDVAMVMNLSASNVKVRLFRLRKRLYGLVMEATESRV